MTTPNEKQLAAGDWFFGKLLHMGANWQTTLSGVGASVLFLLTIVSTISLQYGDLLSMLSSGVKKDVAISSAIATALLKGWNAIAQKSKNVTGGNTAQTLNGDLAAPGTQTLVDITKETTNLSAV